MCIKPGGTAPPTADELLLTKKTPSPTKGGQMIDENESEEVHIIDKLNDQCKKKADASTLKPEDEHYGCFELCSQGHPVFKHRFFPLLYAYWAYTIYGILSGPSLAFTIFAYFITYFYIELYGAVLHIVLDDPLNLKLPLLWDACYEFQFHHIVPHEICVRTYSQICGDLNLIVGLEYAVVAFTFGGLNDPYIRTFVCCAVANAYLGQWAHRQAHFIKSARHPVADILQSIGFLVTPDMHRAHHRTYDTGFPILSGWCDPLMTFLTKKVTTNRWIWLTAFLGMTLAGIACLIRVSLPAYQAMQVMIASKYGISL